VAPRLLYELAFAIWKALQAFAFSLHLSEDDIDASADWASMPPELLFAVLTRYLKQRLAHARLAMKAKH